MLTPERDKVIREAIARCIKSGHKINSCDCLVAHLFEEIDRLKQRIIELENVSEEAKKY